MPTRRFDYPDPSELTLVVRAAGERTEAACVDLFGGQLPSPDQLVVLRERPFAKAVIRCFEEGVLAGRPYLIAVDADILPLPDAVERAREICGKMAPDAFCATPLFLCRTVGGFAMRGLHCYRANLLPEALSLLPDLPSDLRPESRFHDAMKARGHPREVYAKVLGLHEYEQSFRHIYLKSMLRARKDPYAEQIRSRLQARAPHDPDALVALWGFEAAEADPNPPLEYDWTAARPELDRRLAAAGLSEKPTLDASRAAGMALDAVGAHDYRTDTHTEPWIREMLAFHDGGSRVLDAINQPPLFSSPAIAAEDA